MREHGGHKGSVWEELGKSLLGEERPRTTGFKMAGKTERARNTGERARKGSHWESESRMVGDKDVVRKWSAQGTQGEVPCKTQVEHEERRREPEVGWVSEGQGGSDGLRGRGGGHGKRRDRTEHRGRREGYIQSDKRRWWGALGVDREHQMPSFVRCLHTL